MRYSVLSARNLLAARTAFLYTVMLAVAVTAAFAASLALVAATGGPPGGTLSAMFSGSLTSVPSVMTSIDRAIPLLLVASGTVIAGRAGLVNVGQEGQVLMGAFAGTAFGLKVTGSGLLGVAGILLASALAGGIWAGIAALLKNRARVNETVSTLLLNFVAVQVASYLVSSESLLQAPPGAQAVTPGLPNSSSLPTLMNGVGFSLSSGLVLALVLAIASVGLLRGTGFGFELRVLGLNPSCVESFGINRQRLVSVALVLSGATAGLAGGVMLSLYPGGVTPTFSGGVGWDGLLVALVSAYNPLAVVFASFGFGALSAGSQFVVASGVNATIAAVFQATVALAALLPQIFLRRTKTRSMALNAGDGGVLANPQVAPADPGRTPVPPVGVEHSAAAEPRRTGA